MFIGVEHREHLQVRLKEAPQCKRFLLHRLQHQAERTDRVAGALQQERRGVLDAVSLTKTEHAIDVEVVASDREVGVDVARRELANQLNVLLVHLAGELDRRQLEELVYGEVVATLLDRIRRRVDAA